MEHNTYKTTVWLNEGGLIGRDNPATQPAGSVPCLPPRLWAPDSFEWELTLYSDHGTTPFNCQNAECGVYVSADTDGAARVSVGTVAVSGDSYNVLTAAVAANAIPQSLWGGTVRIMVEAVEAGDGKQTTVWQVAHAVYLAVSAGDMGAGAYQISGAGTAAANVIVYDAGASSDGAGDYHTWASVDESITMVWFSIFGGLVIGWIIYSGATSLYTHTSDATTPPASGWATSGGTAPAPTVAAI